MEKRYLCLLALPFICLGGCDYFNPSSSKQSGNGSSESSSSFSSSSSIEKPKTIVVDGKTVPNFAEDTNVDFTAYATPHITTKSVDTIYTLLKNAAFTKVLPLHDGRDSYTMAQTVTAYQNYVNANRDDNSKVKLCKAIDTNYEAIETRNNMMVEKALDYDLQVIPLIEGFYDIYIQFGQNLPVEDYELISKRYIKNIDTTVGKMKSFAGPYMTDEPHDDTYYDAFKNVINYYYQRGLNGKPYINMLPGSNYSDYTSYINAYMEKLFPVLNYLSFDVYPIYPNKIADHHLMDMEICANAIKDADRGGEFRTYIDSINKNSDYNTLATANTDYLRFQMYAAMAYGSREMLYFTMSDSKDVVGTTNRLINFKDYSTSPVYNYASEINHEIRSFGDVFNHFAWQSAMTYGNCTQFSKLKKSVTNTTTLPYFHEPHGNPTLVGNFSDGEQEAFLVMNYQNPSKSTSDSNVKLRFNDPVKTVLVYKDGEVHAYSHSSEYFNLDLKACHAAFVIPLTIG